MNPTSAGRYYCKINPEGGMRQTKEKEHRRKMCLGLAFMWAYLVLLRFAKVPFFFLFNKLLAGNLRIEVIGGSNVFTRDVLIHQTQSQNYAANPRNVFSITFLFPIPGHL